LPPIILISRTSSGIFYGSSTLAGLGLLTETLCDNAQAWITQGYSTC